MREREGFTLIELLIAFALSAFIAVGLFSIISSIVTVREISFRSSENIITTERLTLLLNRDTRMMLNGTYALDSIEDIRKLKFTTNNSLRFNKAVPVEITYYIEDDYLIRREINNELLYDMKMKLIPKVTDMVITFYDGNEYKEDLIADAKIINIEFTINGEKIVVNAGSINE